MVCALVALAIGGITVGGAVVARHRAQAAADLAALAAAGALPAGLQTACRRAETMVTAMRGVVVGCRIDGLDVAISVEVDVGGLTGRARASSRAGPLNHR